MRNQVVTTILATALLAGTALAAAPRQKHQPAPPSATTSAAPTAAKLSPADQKRIAAIEQYQHDVVSVTALRAEPDYLLGAAILAKPLYNRTPGLDFDALSARAAAAPGASAAPQWARLALCKTKQECPNKAAFAFLKQHDSGNAAVWLLELDLAAARKDGKAERAALHKAAAAQSYDDYYGAALGGVAKAVAVLPPLPDTTAGAHSGQPDNQDGVRLFVAFSATQSHPRPDLGPLSELCSKDAVAADDATRQDCLKLAHTLQWGSSPIARAFGLHIQGDLEPDTSAAHEEASRNLAWQVQSYSRVLQGALTDQARAAQWLADARSGGTELSLILATLRANQIPTEAPADAAAPAASAPTGP